MDENTEGRILDLRDDVAQLQAEVDQLTAERDRWQAHAERVVAERDRLRAVVAESAQGIMPTVELIAGIYELPLEPGLSTRFGYCPTCRMVWPPDDTITHECQLDVSGPMGVEGDNPPDPAHDEDTPP